MWREREREERRGEERLQNEIGSVNFRISSTYISFSSHPQWSWKASDSPLFFSLLLTIEPTKAGHLLAGGMHLRRIHKLLSGLLSRKVILISRRLKTASQGRIKIYIDRDR